MTARPPVAQFGDAIEVTQADREVAAKVHERSCYEIVRIQGSQVRRGYGDTDPLVLDFARHRTSTALPLAQPAAVDVGEVRDSRTFYDAVKGYSYPAGIEVTVRIHETGWDVYKPLPDVGSASVDGEKERLREALKRIAYLRPAGDVERCVGAKKLVAQIERIALAALAPAAIASGRGEG